MKTSQEIKALFEELPLQAQRELLEHPNIKHKALLAKDHIDKNDKTIHLQKVNNVHSQLRTFLRPFNGVSSKYLQNYLNWYACADKTKIAKQRLNNGVSQCCSQTKHTISWSCLNKMLL